MLILEVEAGMLNCQFFVNKTMRDENLLGISLSNNFRQKIFSSVSNNEISLNNREKISEHDDGPEMNNYSVSTQFKLLFINL